VAWFEANGGLIDSRGNVLLPRALRSITVPPLAFTGDRETP